MTGQYCGLSFVIATVYESAPSSAFFAGEGSATKHYEITTTSTPTPSDCWRQKGVQNGRNIGIKEAGEKNTEFDSLEGLSSSWKNARYVPAPKLIQLFYQASQTKQDLPCSQDWIQFQNQKRNELVNGLAIQRGTLYGETSWLARLCLQLRGLHSTRDRGKDSWIALLSYHRYLPPPLSSRCKGNSWALFGWYFWIMGEGLFREGWCVRPSRGSKEMKLIWGRKHPRANP